MVCSWLCIMKRPQFWKRKTSSNYANKNTSISKDVPHFISFRPNIKNVANLYLILNWMNMKTILKNRNKLNTARKLQVKERNLLLLTR